MYRKPTRVWVNAPSKLQSAHEHHGKVGIAHTHMNSLNNAITTLYFTEGKVLSMQIDPSFLESRNSQGDILKLNKTDNYAKS